MRSRSWLPLSNRSRRYIKVEPTPATWPFVRKLSLRAEQFVVDRTLIAGQALEGGPATGRNMEHAAHLSFI